MFPEYKKPHRKIKVGIFVEGKFLPSYDGASNRFHYLSRFLQKSGDVDVVLFHCHRGFTDVRLLKKEKFTTYLLSEENYYHNVGLLASIIKEEKIDILQCNDPEPLLNQGVQLSNITGAKLVYEIHYNAAQLAKTLGENDAAINEIIRIQRNVGENIDHAICLSNDDKSSCINDLQIPEDRITIIPSGVDLSENKYHKPNLKNKTIAFLGNLYFQPNEDAVRILRNVIYPKLANLGFSFIIAGECPEKLMRELETESFQFVGAIRNLNRLFRKVSLCAAPILEGTGMRIKFLNFMSGGVPVLTTEIAANGFTDKSNFIIENNIEKYSDAIIDVFESKILPAISKESRKFVEQHYSWEKITSKAIKTYREILNRETKNKKFEAGSFEKPVWLRELINKDRYKAVSQLPDNFSFSRICNGKIHNSSIREVIAIEGMPGAGKTTFVNNLHNIEIKTVKELQVKIPKKIKSDFEIQKLYLLAENGKYMRVFKDLSKYKKIILDRSFISTIAYCFADCRTKGNMKDYEKLVQLLGEDEYTVLWPTKVIVFDCAIDESIYRRRKFKNNPAYKNWFDPVFLNNLKDFYANELSKIITVQTITIDTISKTIDTVSEIVEKAL